MRQIKLARAASDLQRRIYASLPWGYRVARFFLRLASGTIDVFGRVVAAEFIKRGVQGMPDVAGKPAESLREALLKKGTRAGDKLPRNYGRQFAQSVWNINMSKIKNPEIIEEAMVSVVEKLLKNPHLIHEGVLLREAQAFVLRMIRNETIDLLRTKGRRREESLTREDEGEEITLDPHDPGALKDIEGMLTPSTLRDIKRDLDRINESASAYIDAVFNDYSDREIAEGAMLPHMQGRPVSPQALFNWKKRWMPKIEEAIRKHIG